MFNKKQTICLIDCKIDKTVIIRLLLCNRILSPMLGPLQKLMLYLLTLLKHAVILILLYQIHLTLHSKLHLHELYAAVCKFTFDDASAFQPSDARKQKKCK